MTLLSIVLYILIGALAGFAAGKIYRGAGFGTVGNIVVGIVGAFIGGLLFSFAGLSFGGIIGTFFTALVGAIVLLAIVGLVTRGSARRHSF